MHAGLEGVDIGLYYSVEGAETRTGEKFSGKDSEGRRVGEV